MNKKKRKIWSFLLLCSMFWLVGCGRETIEKEKNFLIFIGENGPEKSGYTIKAEDLEGKIGELLEGLKQPPGSDVKSVFPEGLEIEKWELEGDRVSLFFSKKYGNYAIPEELYFRSGVVLVLTQLSDIKRIQFRVDGEGLKDAFGNEMGDMRQEDFLESSGLLLQTYHKSELILYLPKEEGNRLEVKRKKVHYNSSSSLEKIILEQYLKEILFKEENHTEVKIISVSVKDRICYINLDESFLKQDIKRNPKMVIYGIVNSIVENGSVDQVQFSIAGDSKVEYRGQVEFKSPLSPDWSLVEE